MDHLVHLEWLDLSFNNISKIEGLDKLTKLTDLSLFANRIRSPSQPGWKWMCLGVWFVFDLVRVLKPPVLILYICSTKTVR